MKKEDTLQKLINERGNLETLKPILIGIEGEKGKRGETKEIK